MRLKLLAIALTTSVISGSAVAADLPSRVDPPVYIPPPPVWTWTGFYVGANGGYGWGTDNGRNTYTNNIGTVDSSAGPGSAKGGFGGGQFGYNWQMSSFVVGLETDFQGSGISTSARGVTAGGLAFSTNQELDWFGTARGRVGFTFDRVLFYATGGVAYGRVADSAFINTAVNSVALLSGTTRVGYVVGGGIEYAFTPNWSIKGEYQYINLRNETLFGAVVPPNGITIRSSAIENAFSTVRVGINYKFGWAPPPPAAPVIAKY
jgi:outer membrane immunogenic protein